jgi:hypothetical protein
MDAAIRPLVSGFTQIDKFASNCEVRDEMNQVKKFSTFLLLDACALKKKTARLREIVAAPLILRRFCRIAFVLLIR